MKTTYGVCLVAVGLVALAGACQSGSDRAVGSLGKEELCQLSDETFDRIAADSVRITCYSVAIGAASQGAGDCQALADRCIEAAPASVESGECEVAELPACAAKVTIAEVRGCLDAVSDAYARFAEGVSCSTSLDDIRAFDPFASSLPAECRALETTCPGLLDQES